MCCELQKNCRYTWHPKDEKGQEHLLFTRWLRETMGWDPGDWWRAEIDRLADRRRDFGKNEVPSLIRNICLHDAVELTELLFPRWPEWFLTPLEECCMNAVGLCAWFGASVSLSALLEAGADPNGLDGRPCGITYQSSQGYRSLFALTPLDVAELMEQEDCQLLLSLYGGVTSRELYQIPEERTGIPCLLENPEMRDFLGWGCI